MLMTAETCPFDHGTADRPIDTLVGVVPGPVGELAKICPLCGTEFRYAETVAFIPAPRLLSEPGVLEREEVEITWHLSGLPPDLK